MGVYLFNSDELLKLLDDTINLFLKYQYEEGYEEPGARAAAIMDSLQETGASKKVKPQHTAWDSDKVYNSLADILSRNRPIADAAEAFNYSNTLADVLEFLKRINTKNTLGPKDRSTVSEIMGALEVLARRISEWERRALGLDVLGSPDIKYIGTT